MNTILSIDLDILFTPYIGIYNDYIDCKKSCNQNWKDIKEKFFINNISINQEYLTILNNILKIYSEKVNTIYVGFDHSSILTAIEKEKNNFKLPYSFIIHNIDFHHDIFYGQYQSDDIKYFNIANCGDWVGFLAYNNFLTQYYWYYGIGSVFDERMLKKDNQKAIPSFLNKEFNKDFSLYLNIDLLFISISPQWIPISQYSYIKDILLKLPQEKIHFFNEPYFVGSEEKNFLTVKKKPSSLIYFDFLQKLQN